MLGNIGFPNNERALSKRVTVPKTGLLSSPDGTGGSSGFWTPSLTIVLNSPTHTVAEMRVHAPQTGPWIQQSQ